MLVAFEELLRNTNPELEFDTNINTDVTYYILTRAQEEYITQNFLSGDSIQDNINAIRRRSDILANIIKRNATGEVTVAASGTSKQIDGGYQAVITNTDYWMYLSGVFTHVGLTTTDTGSTIKAIDLELINHYDLQNKVRTISNEPVLKKVPIVIEGANKFVFYLSKENVIALDAIISASEIGLIYLATPSEIHGYVNEEDTGNSELASSTHNDIVKLAVDILIREYKYLLGDIKIKTTG